jgi:hypothetical protein
LKLRKIPSEPGSAGVSPAPMAFSGSLSVDGGRDARAPRDFFTANLAERAGFGPAQVSP